MSTIDLQPTLVGPTLTLRPLRAEDFDALHAAASDPLIWEVHPEPTRWQREVFRRNFFDAAIANRRAFAVIENASGRIVGSSRYYDWEPDKREIAIGYTFLVREHWGGTSNREMKRLMLDHAFRHADTVWFHVGAKNWRSRRAMTKLGAELVMEGPRETAGVMMPYVYFRLRKPGLF